jgi:hypothetical protein
VTVGSLSLPLVWRKALRDSDLSRTAKLVGFVISTYMNGDGVAWPSRNTIAAGGSVTVRAVDAAVKLLEGQGFLEVERDGRGGRTRVNQYVAVIPETAHAVHRSEARAALRARRKTANAVQKRANGTPRTGKRVRPKTTKSSEVVAAADVRHRAAPLRIMDDCVRCGERPLDGVQQIGDDWICDQCAPKEMTVP